jgi:hypothetical protein
VGLPEDFLRGLKKMADSSVNKPLEPETILKKIPEEPAET